ncbi:acyl-CoA thioesterase [Streptomyces sp. NPDC048290]|uniref:acyl-CoA thioesterase n=1 Tax=Streptomyces sp. NPDC048290 TaxID=3155811 RepID=UPI00342B1F06
MSDEFSVPVTVRGYETDVQGHLNQAVYLSYAEHARWSLLEAAGIRQRNLTDNGLGPVVLETTIRYLSELLAGDEVTVTCAFLWGEGKTFRVVQRIVKPDGTLAAEVEGISGLLDLTARRLVAAPGDRFKQLATDPGLMGL